MTRMDLYQFTSVVEGGGASGGGMSGKVEGSGSERWQREG